jgi:hypothetical protein
VSVQLYESGISENGNKICTCGGMWRYNEVIGGEGIICASGMRRNVQLRGSRIEVALTFGHGASSSALLFRR